jgi:hypothetical protein
VLRKLVPTVVLAFLAAVPSADAAEATGKSCVLSDPETATVAEILDGETLKLGDGRIVRLIGARRRRSAGAAMILGLSLRSRSRRWISSPQASRSS